jgi:hypothetical protein
MAGCATEGDVRDRGHLSAHEAWAGDTIGSSPLHPDA